MNDIVLSLARAAVLTALDQPESFDLKQALREYPQLQKNGAAFVTLNTMPQVWEQLPRFDAFFGNLCLKANLAADSLLEHPEIYTYQVEKYQEE